MALQDEIDAKSREIHTDGYSMSINELASLYREKEMDIHPEFQRFFRWSEAQKSRLIESILLGIPIPSIFVAQRDDGVWDVVDGLQRISTILEFMGELRDELGERRPGSTLQGTRYLPSLDGKVWEGEEDESEHHSLSSLQRLLIKRSKLDIRIIKRESDPATKYELFQRLNTGGSTLSDQEVRNCLLIMMERSFYVWLANLRSHESYQTAVAASERQQIEQYDLELIVRFLACKNANPEELTSIADLGDFLTDKMLAFADSPEFDREEEDAIFRKTFDILADAVGDDTFRRYDPDRERFMGGFSVSAFETISVGVGRNVEAWGSIDSEVRRRELKERISALWYDDDIFRTRSGTGVRAGTRIPYLVPHGIEVFRP